MDDPIATAPGSDTPGSRVSLNDKPEAGYNQGRSHKSLDASGGSVFLNLLGAAKGALIRAAASAQPFGVALISHVRSRISKALCYRLALAAVWSVSVGLHDLWRLLLKSQLQSTLIYWTTRFRSRHIILSRLEERVFAFIGRRVSNRSLSRRGNR